MAYTPVIANEAPDEGFRAPPVQTQSAAEAFELVLRNAGATRPERDSVDARIVSNMRNGTGRIINDEKEVGGAGVCLR